MGQTSKDIDKILEDIKKRKIDSASIADKNQADDLAGQILKSRAAKAAVSLAQKPQPDLEKAEKAADEAPGLIFNKDETRAVSAKNEKAALSAEDEKKIADFINRPVEDDILPRQQLMDEDKPSVFEEIEAAKKSDDYIDDKFKQFFTQSVVVTKPAEKTNVEIKRKKGGFFKRKYVTDSLSLNLSQPEKSKNEKLPLVKTADDVYDEVSTKENLQLFSNNQADEKPAKETSKISFKAESKPTEKEKAAVYSPRTNEKQSSTEPENSLPTSAVKHADLSAENSDEKVIFSTNPSEAIKPAHKLTAEDLAAQILQKRSRTTQPAIMANETPVSAAADKQPSGDFCADTAKKAENTSAHQPEVKNPIVDSIYTAVIEKQAQEALATDEMTAMLPKAPKEKPKAQAPQHIDEPDEKEDEPVFEEYVSNGEFFSRQLEDDSQDIVSELDDFKGTLTVRIILGILCGAVLIYLNMAAASSLPVPSFISPVSQPLMFYIANAVIFTIAFIGFLPTVISGFTALKKDPAPDSLISLGVVLAAVQLFVMIIRATYIDVAKSTVFAGYICIALAFNAVGKRISTKTIIKNLSLANAPEGINAGYIINDADAVKRLARTLDEKVPRILVSRKTKTVSNFVSAGFSVHKSDFLARKMAYVSYGVTLACLVLGFVVSKNPVTAIFCACGGAALQIPLSQTLVSSLPSALMQKSLEQVGALVNGWQGIDQLSKTTHVSFDARHLFPKGTVILHGIKTFEKERIDLAIIYAASVLIEKCDVLKPVFMEVIEGKTNILFPLESCEYIECQGYVSWIQNNRVIIGNRSLMEKYEVALPPVHLENNFVQQGKKPVYLAVGGKLFGMFVFSYSADKNVKENLDKLIDKGVSIILSSSDFNIDSSLVEKIYGIPRDCVQVLNQKESALLSSFTDYAESSEACVAHLDSLHSLVAGFCGAESAKSAEGICSIVQAVSIVIGAVMALIFTYSQTIPHLPLPSLLLLSFGMMGLSAIGAFAKKY